MRASAVACAMVATLFVVVAAEQKVQPVAVTASTADLDALRKTYGGAFGLGNDLRTLLVHPELAKGILPFASYILAESTLTPRHRELLILKTASLSRSHYLWWKHEPRSRAAGLSNRDLELTPARNGSTAKVEEALLLAAEDLHRRSFVTDSTWRTLATWYNEHELMDAVFTVAEMTMLAGIWNSVGVQTELGGLLPGESFGVPRSYGSDRGHQPLTTPRIEPVVLAQASPEIRQMLDPSGSGREIAAVYRTFARHPKLYVPRQILSEYIRTKSTLSPRVREMLILRIGWRCQSAYEWAAHAPAGRRAGLTDDQVRMLARSGYDGWSAGDAAIVRAADELFDNDRISDATWKALDDQFDERQLLDVLITTGGYRMVSMVLNTFGVPAEPNSEAFPGP